MNGSEHYARAEQLIELADQLGENTPGAKFFIAVAQVHATLAQAAASQTLVILQAEANPDIVRHSDSGQFVAYR